MLHDGSLFGLLLAYMPKSMERSWLRNFPPTRVSFGYIPEGVVLFTYNCKDIDGIDLIAGTVVWHLKEQDFSFYPGDVPLVAIHEDDRFMAVSFSWFRGYQFSSENRPFVCTHREMHFAEQNLPFPALSAS